MLHFLGVKAEEESQNSNHQLNHHMKKITVCCQSQITKIVSDQKVKSQPSVWQLELKIID